MDALLSDTYNNSQNSFTVSSIPLNEKINTNLELHNLQKNEVDIALSSFIRHGLDDLNNANLMSRVDSKFMLPIEFLPNLLKQVKKKYTVLEIDNKRIFRYQNQYFDTNNMRFYHDHHNGKLNRYKVRQRNYIDTDSAYLEVKFKNNKQRTVKTRIKLSQDKENEASSAEFVEQQTGQRFTDFNVCHQSGYRRIALANEPQAERLTLDFDLWYQKEEDSNRVNLSGFFIAELKQNKKNKLSPLYQLMTANNMFPISFSKYCIGCALLYGESVKSNQFKAILSRIEEFKHQSQVSN